MTWFKIDDAFHSHPKTTATSLAALGLWTVAGTWSGDHLTDGFVPDHVIPLLSRGSNELADELVVKGLWRRMRGGYRFHDWEQYQPSKESVVARRASDARRQALFRDPMLRDTVRRRDQDQCRYCGVKVKWSDRRGTLGGTYDHVDPRGGNTVENLVVSCRGCNSQKGGRTPDQAGMKLLPPGDMYLVTSEVPSGDKPVSSSAPTRPDPPPTEERVGGALASLSGAPPDQNHAARPCRECGNALDSAYHRGPCAKARANPDR